MPIDFPNSPSNGATYTVGTKTWQFDGTTWNLLQGTAGIATGAVTEEKLAASAVTESKIHTSAITHSKINDGAVTAGKIASNAVTEAKINDGAVTQNKLASGLSGITVTTTALRSSVVPSPFTGQFVFLTDTNSLQRWDGSSWVVAITTVPTGAPTGLSATAIDDTSIQVSFTAGADGGSSLTNYQYALSTDGGSTFPNGFVALSPADATSPITITGLAAGTTYSIKLKAVNALGTGSSESSTVSATTLGLGVEVLLVGGGGGGATSLTGGAGGGAVMISNMFRLAKGTYAVTVGAGGSGTVSNAQDQDNGGTKGASSIFNGITCTGGGASWNRISSSYYNNSNCTTGANGAGGSSDSGRTQGMPGVAPTFPAGITGTIHAGFTGGNGGGGGNNYPGGGGAGAGANGTTPPNNNSPGHGGNGVLISTFDGTSYYYGGGGGGSGYTASAGAGNGGLGGGGGGGDEANGGGGSGGGSARNSGGNGGSGSNTPGGAGGANTGGGGGAGAHQTGNGGNGGSGIVVIRYPSSATNTITGGTATTSGSYTIRTFTASGSLVIA